ncbi:DUF5691 domain-containing protein [Actinomadura chibensis]|uniref:Uncharacterized protein n=1 Tax=Actinomadura chibensis TaxID=392828 RepID=A0A5D0NEM9_9ACTN|nr:DUF5691 domain-containing protein [Actinomadura chibensis]TYB42759.1 hypothetical protein FXF69_28675 [Actinomadura chibensis]
MTAPDESAFNESTWNELVTVALLGTERRDPPVLPQAPGEPSGETSGETSDKAGRLLDAAALLTVRRRAGLVPAGAAPEPIALAPEEEAPVVPGPAAARLRRILAGEQIRVLPEWLDAAASRGFRVPAQSLPDLLERGRTDRMLRPPIARAAGRRGVWLALQNTDWAYLVGAGDDPGGGPEVWETGTRNRRVAYLTMLRGSDPARARDLLRGTWTAEPAPDRAAFLATFAHGLSLDDEEFLEAALEDRGKDVRQIASDLLARVPGSAYGERMAARARACLVPERRSARGRRQTWIRVEPPRSHDEDMARDGVPFHPSGSFAPRGGGRPVGTRAAWLREILARTPLATWTDLFGLPPMEIVCLPLGGGAGGSAAESAPQNDWASDARDVHIGWARAALAQRDADWARALLKGGVMVDEPEALADLLSVLPEGERDAAAADLIRWVEGQPDLLRVLEHVPGPWTGPLAAAVLAALATAAERPTRRDEHLVTQLCRLADLRLAPSAADRLDDLAAPPDTAPDAAPGAAVPRAVPELIATLRFRAEMLKELST